MEFMKVLKNNLHDLPVQDPALPAYKKQQTKQPENQ
jgi:hypothetical protein